VFGYYGVFVGLQYKNDRFITKALDSGTIDESEAITLKVPIAVPYMPDQPSFKRVQGKFEHNGEFYRLVEQKYANDTLTLVWIKDVEHKNIARALSDFAKTFTDSPGGNQPSKITVSFLKEYLALECALRCSSPGWMTTLSYTVAQTPLHDSFASSIVHPPELL